jgi:hypothetical protein
MNTKVLTSVVTAAALLLTVDREAQASCVPKALASGNNLSYQLCGAPDLDQIRAKWDVQPFPIPGLPNNGSMYCGPTSVMNFMAYMANHGRPSLKPGPRDWSAQGEPFAFGSVNYTDMTYNLKAMGEQMHTDPFLGTSGEGLENGLRCWFLNVDFCALDPHFKIFSPDLLVLNLSADKAYSPTFVDMAQAAVTGALVVPSTGWYDNSAGYYKRVGGHVLTMITAELSGANGAIGLYDPAFTKNDDEYSQSQFTLSGPYPIKNVFSNFDNYYRMQSQIPTYGESAFLDGLVAMRPMFVLSSDGSMIQLLKASLSLPGNASPAASSFITAGQTITDISTHPAMVTHPYLAQGDSTVWQVNELTGQLTRFASVPSPKRLVFGGREQQLHVLGDRQITTLSRTGQALASVALPEPADAVAYDKDRDTLIAVAPAAGKLRLFTPSLQSQGVITMAPIYCSGPVRAQAEPGKPALWIHCAGQDSLTRVDMSRQATGLPATTRSVKLQAALIPSSFSMGENGYLYVSDGGVLHVYDLAGSRVRSPFDGLQAGKLVDVGRSFSNFDPATMVGPKYRNVLPQDAVR